MRDMDLEAKIEVEEDKHYASGVHVSNETSKQNILYKTGDIYG